MSVFSGAMTMNIFASRPTAHRIACRAAERGESTESTFTGTLLWSRSLRRSAKKSAPGSTLSLPWQGKLKRARLTRPSWKRKRSHLGAMATGSALTALASGAAVGWSVHYPGSSPVKALAIVWAVIAVAYIAYAWRLRRR
jgi:hypothetical protein